MGTLPGSSEGACQELVGGEQAEVGVQVVRAVEAGMEKAIRSNIVVPAPAHHLGYSGL